MSQFYLNSKTYGCQEYFISAHIVETHYQLSTKRITSLTYLVVPINLFKYLKICNWNVVENVVVAKGRFSISVCSLLQGFNIWKNFKVCFYKHENDYIWTQTLSQWFYHEYIYIALLNLCIVHFLKKKLTLKYRHNKIIY